MIKLQTKKDKYAVPAVRPTRAECAIGHQPHRSGVGVHRNRTERRAGRRVLAERAIRDFG